MKRFFALLLTVSAALVTGCTTVISGTPSSASAPMSTGCTGDVVAPQGAPYCYLMPAGFKDVSSTMTMKFQSKNTGSYTTAVALGDLDLLTVTVYPLKINSDILDLSVLGNGLDSVLAEGAATFTRQGPPQQLTIDGGRALDYPVKATGDAYSAQLIFVFKGKTEIELNCQYLDRQADIERGCLDVQRTIRISGDGPI